MKVRGKRQLQLQNDVSRGVRWCNIILTLAKDVTNTCKRMRNSPTIARFLQCDGRKMEEAEDFRRVDMYDVYCVLESKYTSSSA